MDLTTVIGLIAGLAVIVLGISNSGSVVSFIDTASVFIVVGGTGCAVIVNYPINELVGVISVVKKTLFTKTQPITETIATIMGEIISTSLRKKISISMNMTTIAAGAEIAICINISTPNVSSATGRPVI